MSPTTTLSAHSCKLVRRVSLCPKGCKRRVRDASQDGLCRVRPAHGVVARASDTSTSASTSTDVLTNSRVSEKYKPFLDQWDTGFSFNHEPVPEGCWMPVVSGRLPPELEGTYFKNGPGRFSQGSQAYEHPYDGDGLVASIAFKGGKAFFRSRFIATPELSAEEAAGKVLFRGTFATQREGGWGANMLDLYIKNTSNTNVVPWRGSLLTFFEAALPYRLDPYTLETLGLEDLGGRVRPGMPFKMDNPFARSAIGVMQRAVGANSQLPPEYLYPDGHACTAHPHVDSSTGRLCLFTYQAEMTGDPCTQLTFWELDPESGAPHCSREYSMPGGFFMHDFALTQNYYILFQSPVQMDYTPYILGRTCAASCIRWAPATPTYIHIIPRPGSEADRLGERTRVLDTPPTFIFHHANAFEEERERGRPPVLVVDSIHYSTLPAVGKEALDDQHIDPDAGFQAKLKRVRIDLATAEVDVSPPLSEYLELPCINDAHQARPHRYIYGYESNFPTPSIAISKVDTHTGRATAYQPGYQYFITEPEFVPRPGAVEEDDGWVVAIAFDSGRCASEVVVLDAKRVEEGPVAVLAVPRPLPHGLHGNWSGTYFGPQE